MLGSDYPFPLGEAHPGQLIESMQQLSANVKVRCYYRDEKEPSWFGFCSVWILVIFVKKGSSSSVQFFQK